MVHLVIASLGYSSDKSGRLSDNRSRWHKRMLLLFPLGTVRICFELIMIVTSDIACLVIETAEEGTSGT